MAYSVTHGGVFRPRRRLAVRIRRVFRARLPSVPVFTPPDALPGTVEVEAEVCSTFRTNPRTFVELMSVLRTMKGDFERACNRITVLEGQVGEPSGGPPTPVAAPVSLLESQATIRQAVSDLQDFVAVLTQPNPMVLLQTDETLIRE